jgi:hypothetical protein
LPLGIMFDQHLYTIKYVSGRSMQVRILWTRTAVDMRTQHLCD